MSLSPGVAPRPVLILTALILAEVVAAFEGGMIWAAVRVLQELLGDSVTVGWVISSYYLVSAGAAVIGARLGDIFGRKRVLLYVLFVAGIGSLVCALFPENLAMLLIGRAIQGTSAAILPLCYGIARELLPQDKVMPAVGLLSGTMGVAVGAGLLLGGLVVDYFQWYWIFYMSVIMAVIAMITVAGLIPRLEINQDGSRLDMLGGVLFPPAMALLLFGVTQARYWTWMDWRIWSILLTGAALLGYWSRHEWRQRQPLINVRLLVNREVVLCLGCMILACGAMQTSLVLSMVIQAPSWTGVGLGLGATIVGIVALVSQIAGLGGGLWAGVLIERTSTRYTLFLGALLLVVPWGALTAGFFMGYSSLWLVTLCFLVYGVGMTMILAVIPMALIKVVPPDRTSEATGMASVVRQIFLAVTTQVVSALLAYSVIADPLRPETVYPSTTAYTLAAAFITLSSLAIIWAAAGFPKLRPATAEA